MDSYSKPDKDELINSLHYDIKYKRKGNKIKLIKEHDFCNSIISISPILIESTSKKDSDLLEEKIKYFLVTMIKKCPNFNPKIFIKNYKKTFFNLENLGKNYDGSVTIDTVNKFRINSFDVAFHELFHLSSLKKEIPNKFLIPFNEGYTQLLAERYFKENIGIAYSNEVIISMIIELVIGKNIMEKNFFEGNYHKNIEELTKYIENDKKNALLFYMNKINEWGKNRYTNKDMLNSLMNASINILSEGLINKLNNMEDYEEKQKLVTEFSKILNIVIGDKYNIILSGNKLEEINNSYKKIY